MLKETLASGCALIDSALDRLLPPETQVPTSIHKAMRHSVFAGGKRLRPILCVEAARMVFHGKVAGDLPEGVEELALRCDDLGIEQINGVVVSRRTHLQQRGEILLAQCFRRMRQR